MRGGEDKLPIKSDEAIVGFLPSLLLDCWSPTAAIGFNYSINTKLK